MTLVGQLERAAVLPSSTLEQLDRQIKEARIFEERKVRKLTEMNRNVPIRSPGRTFLYRRTMHEQS